MGHRDGTGEENENFHWESGNIDARASGKPGGMVTKTRSRVAMFPRIYGAKLGRNNDWRRGERAMAPRGIAFLIHGLFS